MIIPRRAWTFLGITFGITWTIAGIGALCGVDVESPYYTAVAGACMFGPGLAALIHWRLIERAPWSAVGLHPRSIKPRGLLLTTLLGMLIIPMCLLVIHVFGNVLHLPGFGQVEVTGERFAGSIRTMMHERGLLDRSGQLSIFEQVPGMIILLGLLLAAVLASYTVNLPFMLGEELGWRGFLYDALRSSSPAHRVLFTGPVWGLWHAPLILMGHNYPGYPWIGVGLMVVFCTSLALLFDWSRARTNSVWGPCVLHGIINGSAGAFVFFGVGGHVLVASPAGAAGAFAIAVLGLVVVLADPRYRSGFFGATSGHAAADANFVT